MGDNTRIWAMHCLNLGKSHRINYPRSTNPWGAILYNGLGKNLHVKDLLPGHSTMTKCKCQKCNCKVKGLGTFIDL